VRYTERVLVLWPRTVSDGRFTVFKMRQLKTEQSHKRNFNAKAHTKTSTAGDHRHAAIDCQPLAGDVLTGIRRIQHAQTFEVFIIAQPTQG